MLLVNALAGCLSGDTLINVNRAKKGSKMTLERLVKQFNGEKVYYQRSDNGASVSMRPWNQSICTYVSCNINSEVRLSKLKNAWFSGNKQTYLLITEGGRSIRATNIHPFLLADNTWCVLSNLKEGMKLCVNVGKSSNGKTEPKRNYKHSLTKYHPYQINNGLNFKVATHRLIIEASMNGTDLESYLYMLRERADLCTSLLYLSPEEIVHHKDEDHLNNSLTNLEVLKSVQDHAKEHTWDSNVLDKIGTDTVKSIVPYCVEATYDLQLETEPHNFLANDFVVHNTGKTTTICWGLGVKVPTNITISKEQLEIVKFMRSFKWDSCAAMAFNRSIADELVKRLDHIPGIECTTSNGFGFRNWKSFMAPNKVELNGNKLFVQLKEKLTKDQVAYKDYNVWMNDVIQVVRTIKYNITDFSAYEEVIDINDIVLDLQAKTYCEWLYNESKDSLSYIDFDDQLYMPYIYDVPIAQYDLVVVDEAQDLNKAKQWLAQKMARKYMVCIGDANQAIYGFSGADSQSMDTMGKYMSETWTEQFETLSLTVTRRCPKTVVTVANKYVPTLKAADEAPDGQVLQTTEEEFGTKLIERTNKCMVLCRTNAPLMSLAFYLIRNNRPCYIQGKDIGSGLVKLLNSCKGESLKDKLLDLDAVVSKKTLVYEEKGQMDKAELLRDKALCIRTICDSVTTIEEFKDRITKLFKDSGSVNEHQLCSVHKSKGLEHDWVCIYKPSLLPLMLKPRKGKRVPKGAQQQEFNLAYVAYTRSQNILEFVTEPVKKK